MESLINFFRVALDLIFSPSKSLYKLTNSPKLWPVLCFPLILFTGTEFLSWQMAIPPYVHTADTLVYKLIIDDFRKNYPNMELKSNRFLSALLNDTNGFLEIDNKYFENNMMKRILYITELSRTKLLEPNRKGSLFFNSGPFETLSILDKYAIYTHSMFLETLKHYNLLLPEYKILVREYQNAQLYPGSTYLQNWLEYELNLRYSEDVIKYMEKYHPELLNGTFYSHIAIEKFPVGGIISELAIFCSMLVASFMIYCIYLRRICLNKILGAFSYLAAVSILFQFSFSLVVLYFFPSVTIHILYLFRSLCVGIIAQILLLFPIPNILEVNRIKFFILINCLWFGFEQIKNYIPGVDSFA